MGVLGAWGSCERLGRRPRIAAWAASPRSQSEGRGEYGPRAWCPGTGCHRPGAADHRCADSACHRTCLHDRCLAAPGGGVRVSTRPRLAPVHPRCGRHRCVRERAGGCDHRALRVRGNPGPNEAEPAVAPATPTSTATASPSATPDPTRTEGRRLARRHVPRAPQARSPRQCSGRSRRVRRRSAWS